MTCITEAGTHPPGFTTATMQHILYRNIITSKQTNKQCVAPQFTGASNSNSSVGKPQTENELNQTLKACRPNELNQTHQQNELTHKLICYRLPINQTVNQALNQ